MFVPSCILQELTGSVTAEVTEKRPRVEKNPRGGKATTSKDQKGDSLCPLISLLLLSRSQEDDRDIPEEASEMSNFEEPVGDGSVGTTVCVATAKP